MRLAGKQHIRNDIHQLLRFRFLEAPLRDPRRPHADPRWVHCRFIPWNGVAVDHDAGNIQDARRHIPRQPGAILPLHRAAVQVHQVRVRAAKGDAETPLPELLAHRRAVLQHLPLKLAELPALCQLKGHRHRRKNVHVRPALLAREDRPVNLA